MNINEHLHVVLLSGVKQPLDFVLGTVSASNVGTVRLQGPVADGETDDLNLTGSHLLELLLCDPGVPVIAQHSVSFLWSKRLTERVLVYADSLCFCLQEEAIEERRSDPGLNDLPATDVGTDHGSAVCRSRGTCCEQGSASESFHLLNLG